MFNTKSFDKIKVIVGILLIAALMLSLIPSAFADEKLLMDANEIQKRFDDYIKKNDLNPDIISVGYVYLDTDETWYHNEDMWYESASLYKVPLMMLYAEQEAHGLMNPQSTIYGWTLGQVEEESLVYSNNEIAYSAMQFLGDPSEVRQRFEKFASLPKDYYTGDFIWYSCFTAKFMTEVMKTLYENPDEYPHVADYLKQAQPGHYFKLHLQDCPYDIAQKYGSYEGFDGKCYNHTAGIFYTPHPFILTVMTRYSGIAENIIGDLAKLFYEYSIELAGEYDKTALVPTANAEEKSEEKSDEPNVMIMQSNTITEDPKPNAQVTMTSETLSAPAPEETPEAPEAKDDSFLSWVFQGGSEKEQKTKRAILYALIALTVVFVLVCVLGLVRGKKIKKEEVEPKH